MSLIDAAVVRLRRRSYDGLEPPFHPPERYPELGFLPPASPTEVSEVYPGVRRLFFLLGYDRDRFGTPEWNPLGDLVRPGDRVVLKPNWVRHFNGNPDPDRGSLDSVVTHPAVYRPVVDYCLKALDGRGSVIIADAPQMDCQFDRLREYLRLDELIRFYREEVGAGVEWRDLRDESVIFEDGLVQDRTRLDGDPDGYEIVDLGDRSAFEVSGAEKGQGELETEQLRPGLSDEGDIETSLLRGADYDEEETIYHHSEGRHEYKVSKTILSADVVINLPKVKTHKKAGVTLALKNLVGINCNKNFLPHHRAGPTHKGGDEFPGKSLYKRFRSWAIELSRPFLKKGRFMPLFRMLRKVDLATRPEKVIRSGNWYGNDTIWRTILDLNVVLHCVGPDGGFHPQGYPGRKVLHLFEGVVAAEAEGPMAGDDRGLGVLAASEDPIAGDLVVVRLMGFDWRKITKIRAAMEYDDFRFTDVRAPEDVAVHHRDESRDESGSSPLPDFTWNFELRPHSGWEDYLESDAGRASQVA